MNVTDNADWLFDLNEIWLSGKRLESLVKKLHKLRFRDGTFSCEEVFDDTPLRNVVSSEHVRIFHGFVDDSGALFVVQSTIVDWIWKHRKVLRC